MSNSLFSDVPTTPARDQRAAYREEFLAQQKARKFDAIHIPEDYRPDPFPELHGERVICLNAETTGLKWWDGDRPVGWSYWLPASGRRGYLPIRHKRGDNHDPETFRRWARGELHGVHLENVNTKFDLHMSREDGCDLLEVVGSVGDVAHKAALLDDHRLRFNLDQLALDELGWDVENDPIGKIPAMIETEGDFKELPACVVAPYAIRNVEQVARLAEAYQPRLEDEELLDVLELEQSVLPVVVEMERNGLVIDQPLLERWHGEVSQRIDAIKFRIFKDTGLQLDSFDSSKQLAQLFQRRGVPVTQFTAGGQPSFTDGVMREAAKGDPIIALAREGGQLVDLHSKYLDKYLKALGPGGWLRFNLHQLRSTGDGEEHSRGTVSGRFSAAGDRLGGFNPQQVVAVEKQLERGWCPDYVVRKLVIPGPNEVKLFAADMQQVEYRLFAHYANDPQINAAYAADPLADFHAVVMKLLHQVNPGLNRKLVKNVNFALIYGAALIKFAFMLGMITEAVFLELTARMGQRDFAVFKDPRLAEADALLKTYHQMFPRVKPLMDQTKTVARERGYVKTIMGRRARLTDRFHSALNRIVQGGAADINKRVLVELYKVRQQLGIVLRCTVHDEVVGGLMAGANVSALESALNTQYFKLNVPILWDYHDGANWAECK